MGEAGRIGVIAGGGDLPWTLVAALLEQGKTPFVIGISGFVDEGRIASVDGVVLSVGEIGKQVAALKRAACDSVVFTGIVKRPDFSNLRVDIKGAARLPALISAARKGDDALLRAVVETFEKEGFSVVGADELVGGLLVSEGALGSIAPNETDDVDIEIALKTAIALGALDVGQGAVACRGVVLAVEAQEGTDQMLARCAELPSEIRGTPDNRAGVLVKVPKPAQERRIDLPTIGPQTIEAAAKAGLAGIAVGAGAALIVDRARVTELANLYGLFVVGLADEASSEPVA